MGQIISNKKRNGHAIGTVLGITMVVILLLAGSAGAAPFAYITNQGSNNVSVIDTATNTVIASMNAGSNPQGVAVTPDGTKLYVINPAGTLSVINTTNYAITATINTGGGGGYPRRVAVNPDGTKVYVGVPSGTTIDQVFVINTTTNIVMASVNVGSYVMGIAVNPAGTKVYVANQLSSNVSVINTSTNTVIASVPIGTSIGTCGMDGCPTELAVNPSGTRVYVVSAANGGQHKVSVIDTSNNTVIATIPVGVWPTGIAVTPDGTKVYVSTSVGYSNTVTVIDTTTNSIIRTVPVGSNPQGVAVTPDGTKVYVANTVSNTVSVIETTTDTVTDVVPVGTNPRAFGLFIGPAAIPTPSNTVGYSAIVPSGQQNTFIQATNGSFGTIPKGQSGTIIKSVVLNNTGDADATVDARFSTGAGAIYGLVNGSNILGAGNFSLGRSSVPSWTALLNSGVNTRVAVAPSGAETALDARLYVPVNQPGGAYSGTVVLTFGNGV